jgi:hypothetical protein
VVTESTTFVDRGSIVWDRWSIGYRGIVYVDIHLRVAYSITSMERVFHSIIYHSIWEGIIGIASLGYKSSSQQLEIQAIITRSP